MNIITSLIRLEAHYPSCFLLLLAGIKGTSILVMGHGLSMLLAHRSARARNWVWRATLASLALLGAWTARPASFQDVGLMVPIVTHSDAIAIPSSANHAIAVTEPPAMGLKTSDALQTPVAIAPALPSTGIKWLALARILDSHLLDLWAAVAITLAAIVLLRNTLGLVWLRRHSTEVDPRTAALSPPNMCCRVSSKTDSPLITGYFRPTIWLPAASSGWPDLRIQAAFAHELAHYRRRDLVWQALSTLTACLWWWHPLAWLAHRHLQAEAEEDADDCAITRTLNPPDYAEALVEIASGGTHTPPRTGIAMLGHRELERRVRAMLAPNRWRDRLGFLASSTLVLASLLMAGVVLVGCQKQPPQYISLAKLVAGGRMVSASAGGPQYQEYLSDFYGTIIETLESSEMRKHANERVHALNPDLKACDVAIQVTQKKGSAIFNVSAIGSDPKYTRVFLDALLDEFRAFREQIREQQRNKALNALAEDVTKRETSMKEAADKLTAFKKANNVVILGNGQNQAADFLKQTALEKNRLLLKLSDIDLAEKDAALATELATTTDLNQAQRDYLATKSSLVALKAQHEALLKKRGPTHADVVELNEKVDAATSLLAAYVDQIRQQQRGQKAAIERQIKVLDERLAEFTTKAQDDGEKLAEYERLNKQLQDDDRAYKAMFDLVHKFQINEEMSSDYVQIMERASSAVEQVRGWW